MLIFISKTDQTGAVLFVGLITLLVLSLVAVSSMQSSTLEQRMAGNINDQILAFEAAEAALFEAELLLQSNTLAFSDFQNDDTDGFYEINSDTIWVGIQNGTVNTRTSVDYVPNSSNPIKTAPTFVIQYLGLTNTYKPPTPSSPRVNTADPVIELYRITARGTGRSDNSIVVLESTYGISNSTDPSVFPFLGRQSWRQIDL